MSESTLPRSARRLRWVTLAATIVIETVILVSAWLVVSGQQDSVAAIRVHSAHLPPPATAICLLLIGLLVGLALLRLSRMLGRIAGGERFGAASDLRAFSFYLFLSVLVSIFGTPFFQAVRLAAGGPHQIGLSFELGDALMLLVTGLLFLVARLLEDAQSLAEDHEQIV